MTYSVTRKSSSRPLLQKILPVENFVVFSTLDEIYVLIAQVDDVNLLLNLALTWCSRPTLHVPHISNRSIPTYSAVGEEVLKTKIPPQT